jgi:metallo-beta-lactamase class B
VEKLGFPWRDTKILLISHAHSDHAGGAAEVLRQTGAKLMVMDGDVSAMESGGKAQYGSGLSRFKPAHVDRVLHDGDTVRLGGLTLTAHKTPGHTRGCTTWTLQVHEPGQTRPLQAVIVGSWSVLNSYRLVSTPCKPASYPKIAQDFAHTFTVAGALPGDIFLGAHASSFDILQKLARIPEEGDRVWIDPQGYREAVAAGRAAFEQRLKSASAAGQ